MRNSDSTPNNPGNTAVPQLDGIIVLNKPSGPTSAACLNTLKRLGQKKIGHAGTLDPLASGVLIALLGQATKLSSFLLAGGKKVYSGQLRLGIETDTWDIQGKILAERSIDSITAEMISDEIENWKDLRAQEVPAYSAAKHNGRALYKIARNGEEVPLKIKNIFIYEAKSLEISLPYVDFRVAASSGSYIRSLAHSLGKRLGCGAVLSSLLREYSHPFGLEQSIDLEEIRNRPDLLLKALLPLEAALPDWPKLELTDSQERLVRNGCPLAASALPSSGSASRAILRSNDRPMALVRKESDQWLITRGLWN